MGILSGVVGSFHIRTAHIVTQLSVHEYGKAAGVIRAIQMKVETDESGFGLPVVVILIKYRP
ncbi:MAG: hypothetical protein ACNA8K_05050 [Cyclonatronaceae bacterium]